MTLIWRVLPILFLATTVFAQDGWWDKRGTRYGAAPDILKISGSVPSGKEGPGAGALYELGRIRGEKYQIGIFYLWLTGSGGNGWMERGTGVLGFGKRKLLEKNGNSPFISREWGYLLWPLSSTEISSSDDTSVTRVGSVQLYYRLNTRFVSFEAGLMGTLHPIVKIYFGLSI